MALRTKFLFIFIISGTILNSCDTIALKDYNSQIYRHGRSGNVKEIQGKIVDWDGNPVPDANIHLQSDDLFFHSKTDNNGNFTIVWTYDFEKLHLRISADNYISLDYPQISLQEIIESKCQFLLTKKSTIRDYDSTASCILGYVRDSRGIAITGANIQIEGTAIGKASGLDGKFIFENIPPGKYNVYCCANMYSRKIIRGLNVAPGYAYNLFIILNYPWRYNSQYIAFKMPPRINMYETSNKWYRNSYRLSQKSSVNINQALKACPGISR
jgi:hypothetical protein